MVFYAYLRLTLSTLAYPAPLHPFFEVATYVTASRDLLRLGWITASSAYSYLFLLFSVFPDSTVLPWFELVLYSISSVLVVRVLEGAWWIYFPWYKSALACLLHYWTLLFVDHKEHHLYRRDVRFHFRASLSVTLTGFNTTLFRTTWHSRTSTPHHNQFRIRVRLRLRYQLEHEPVYKSAGIKNPFLQSRRRCRRDTLPRVSPCSATKENLQDRNPDSSEVEQATSLYYRTYLKYYKACTDGTYPRFRDTLEFESYYGISKQAAQNVMKSLMNPLDWYLQEKKMLLSNVLTIKSDAVRLQKGYYAAIALASTLGLEGATPQLAGTFLSKDSSSSEIPLIFDTGCGFSISPVLDDFVIALGPPPEGVRVEDFASGNSSYTRCWLG